MNPRLIRGLRLLLFISAVIFVVGLPVCFYWALDHKFKELITSKHFLP